MAEPVFRVRCHYSGLLMGYSPDAGGLVVLARDHEELSSLMERALKEGRRTDAIPASLEHSE